MSMVIKAGTILTIDEVWSEKVDQAVEDGVITLREHEMWCSSVYARWLPTKIEFFHSRVDRKRVFLAWRFYNDPDLANLPHYNLKVFKKLGYEIIEPEQEELDIMTAPEDLLDDSEKVLKYLIRQNAQLGKHRAWSEGIFKKVQDAMKKAGVVFYTP